MANVCTACRHHYDGHRACPACGHSQYVSTERHAGMAARGPVAYERREELKAAGFRWDADRRGLQCGFWLSD